MEAANIFHPLWSGLGRRMHRRSAPLAHAIPARSRGDCAAQPDPVLQQRDPRIKNLSYICSRVSGRFAVQMTRTRDQRNASFCRAAPVPAERLSWKILNQALLVDKRFSAGLSISFVAIF